ncbi:hypothetical protein V2J09_010745 [Rumex salicifolius]
MDSAINASSSSLVQEITASLTNQPIPEKFIHKNGYPPAEEAIAEDLLIDFSRISAKDELGKLRSALSAFGCFQVVNHGIDTELLEKVLEVSRQFFALPLEEKMKCYGAAGLFNGYGNDGVLRGNQTQNWNDRLYLRVGSKDPADLEFWPENPPEFRKVVRELSDKIEAMPKTILKAMARSLELEDDCFVKHHGLDGGFTFKLNFYPKCPNPEHVLGISPHSDGTTFTMLLQDQRGLHIMANDCWFDVPVIPGAIFVNVGDLMEIMSNGIIKSTLHRVVTSADKERVSVAMFYSPSSFKEIGPINELVTVDRPQLYKKTNILNYGKVFRNCIQKGSRPLFAFRV